MGLPKKIRKQEKKMIAKRNCTIRVTYYKNSLDRINRK